MQYSVCTIDPSTPPYAFGDLLALARQHWIHEVSGRLDTLGYRDYRRTDAGLLRLLARTPTSITLTGRVLGISRQAARKSLDSLIERGFATESREHNDARRVRIVLTDAGVAYARAMQSTISAMNSELAARVTESELAAADTVLRASITNADSRGRADYLVEPPTR